MWRLLALGWCRLVGHAWTRWEERSERSGKWQGRMERWCMTCNQHELGHWWPTKPRIRSEPVSVATYDTRFRVNLRALQDALHGR